MAGLVTELNKPASYYCSVGVSASGSVPINFDSKEFDDDNMVATSASVWKWTAKNTGLAEVVFNGYSTSSANFDVYKNGIYHKPLIYSISSSNSMTGICKVKVVPTDFIDIRPSGSVTVQGGSLNSHNTSSVVISMVNY